MNTLSTGWQENARRILLGHAQRYPLMQLEDLYKLIHQASFGSEHAIQNPDSAFQRLRDEWVCMGEGPPEPLCEEISPDGLILRVHLRPYAASGGDLETLFSAFLQTATGSRSRPQDMLSYAECAIALAEQGELLWRAEDIRRFIARRREEGWPVVHHSEAYRKTYRPAYRVIASCYWLPRGGTR